MTKTESEIKLICESKITELGYKLYDVMFVKEAGEWFLRFFIERQDGSNTDLDDCEKVSQAIEPILDEKDPIAEKYNLEVSSCGLERHLREKDHFLWAVEKNIQVKTFKPINKSKEFEGILNSFDDGILNIKTQDNGDVLIDITDVAGSKILFNWEELKDE